MAEDWLYKITFKQIADIHDLSLVKLYEFTGKIKLPSLKAAGTLETQIDIVAADLTKKILVFAEAKEWLTFPGASECAEQLTMKLFFLRHYLSKSIGSGENSISPNALKDYRLIQYVSLGSYTGNNYSNAKCSAVSDLKTRLDHYTEYMQTIDRSHIGFILFINQNSTPIVRRATLMNWLE